MTRLKYLQYEFTMNNRPRVFLAALFWALSAACAIAVFCFSQQDATESQTLSEGLQKTLADFFGGVFGHNFLRKAAHFSEYAALAFLLSWALFFTRRRYSFLPALFVSALYAVSDEIHQHFIPGRACRVTDILIDSGGALLGISVFTALLALITFCLLRRRKSQ